MISIILLTIGSAKTNIIIFPDNKILSAIEDAPASLHKLAENSVMYPTPIIFKIVENNPEDNPLFSTIELKAPKILVNDSTNIKSITIPPDIVIITETSGLICLTIKAVIAVIIPTPTILKMSKLNSKS